MISIIRSSVLLILLPFIALSGGNDSSPPANNKYVRFSVRLGQPSLKRGGTGTLLFRLAPQAGIHINTVPPIAFTLDESSGIALTGKLQHATVTVDTSVFLDTSKTIRQSFTVAPSVKPGRQMLKGTLTYFYCSDAEGWCSRYKQPVEITIAVLK